MSMLCCKIVGRRATSGLTLRSISFANYASYSSSGNTGVLESRYGEIEAPNQTLSQFVWSKSENWKDKPAVTCGVTGRSYTFGAARALSNLGAQSLLTKTSLRPGERVALLLPNIPEYLIAVHAGLQAGLVLTFANPLHTVDELTRQFRDVAVRCIVTVPQLLGVAQTLAERLDGYDCTINIGGQDKPQDRILALESLAKPSRGVELPDIDPHSLAVLPFSSGTTGLPKGVMLTHSNLVHNIVQFSHPSFLQGGDATIDQRNIFTILPFFHIFGFNGILNYFTYIGMNVITIPKFLPKDYVSCLAEYQPSALFTVPSLMHFLSTSPEISAGEHLANVRDVFCGAAPLKRGLIDNFYRKIGRTDCCVCQGYGMTETSPGVIITPYTISESKHGSCGQLLPSTRARIVDLDTGNDCGPNEPGELWIKGPQVMRGYWNNAKATTETIDSEGWLHTGDVFYYDEDEYFYVVDRTKELIKVKGNQVSPTELESLILEIPGVADAAVIGVADPVAGELPKAYVVRKPGFDITADQVQLFITPKVAPYKKLAGGVSFIEAIPRNASGKILRSELKNRSS